MKSAIALTTFLLIFSSTSALADITVDLDLVNTGTNTFSSVDLSYTYDYPSLSDTGNTTLIKEGQFPLDGSWLNNSDVSKWITVPFFVPTDTYWSVSTQFTLLDTYDLSTVAITGRWLADTLGINIQLNGQDIGFSTSSTTDPYLNWTEFVIDKDSGYTDYLQTGVNTLTFNLYHATGGDCVSGVRIEMDGTAVIPVPEPSTYAMLGLGFLMVGAVVRRRRINH